LDSWIIGKWWRQIPVDYRKVDIAGEGDEGVAAVHELSLSLS
jgi:hypothetical protein